MRGKKKDGSKSGNYASSERAVGRREYKNPEKVVRGKRYRTGDEPKQKNVTCWGRHHATFSRQRAAGPTHRQTSERGNDEKGKGTGTDKEEIGHPLRTARTNWEWLVDRPKEGS